MSTMFTPFGTPGSHQAKPTGKPGTAEAAAAMPTLQPWPAPQQNRAPETLQASEKAEPEAPAKPDELAEMRSQLAAMQSMIEKLAKADRS